jgi:hypothetical protein
MQNIGNCNGQKYRDVIRPNSPIDPWTWSCFGWDGTKKIRTDGATSSPMISTTYPTTPYNLSTTPLLSLIPLLYIMHHKHRKKGMFLLPQNTEKTNISSTLCTPPKIHAGTFGAHRRAAVKMISRPHNPKDTYSWRGEEMVATKRSIKLQRHILVIIACRYSVDKPQSLLSTFCWSQNSYNSFLE